MEQLKEEVLPKIRHSFVAKMPEDPEGAKQ